MVKLALFQLLTRDNTCRDGYPGCWKSYSSWEFTPWFTYLKPRIGLVLYHNQEKQGQENKEGGKQINWGKKKS